MANDFDEFLEAIGEGLDIETSAFLIGASPSAIFRLLERGKNEQYRLSSGSATVKPKASEAKAMELWVEVAKRRSRAILHHVRKINQAEDWKASQKALEHLHPAGFGTQGSAREVEASRLGEIEAGL